MRRLWTVALWGSLALVSAPWGVSQGLADVRPAVALVHQTGLACAPRCDRVIIIDGELTADTPRQLRKIVARLGGAKLPVIINSPGGRLSAAVETGRIIRKARLDVMVARSTYLNADTVQVAADEGVCTSACPFVLAGGVNRSAASGTMVGLHQALMVRHSSSRHGLQAMGGNSELLAQSNRNAQAFRAMRASLRAYLSEMGVSRDIVAEMDKAPPSSMNILDATRLRALGLVSGDVAQQGDMQVETATLDPLFPVGTEPMP